jgi:hypothetical protein
MRFSSVPGRQVAVVVGNKAENKAHHEENDGCIVYYVPHVAHKRDYFGFENFSFVFFELIRKRATNNEKKIIRLD